MYEIVNRYPYRMVHLFNSCENQDECLSMLYDPDAVQFQRGAVHLNDNGLSRILNIVRQDDLEWGFMASKRCFSSENQVPASKLYCIAYEEEDQQYAFSDTKSFNPDQPCQYHELFEEMDAAEEAERNRAYGILQDSRNFSRRISARIIDNELHIFYETYNYDKPELCEYYLMDYCGGTYHFSVSDASRFMTLYLTPDKYKKIYGNCNAMIKEQYDSLEPLREMLKKIPKFDFEYEDERRIVRQKMETFRRMQKEIDHMRLKLKLGRAFIRSRSLLYCEVPGAEFIAASYLIHYFEAEAEFHCTDLDQLSWESMCVECYNKSKKPAAFKLSNGRTVKLSRKDLVKGFELGFDTIEEIGRFLLKYGKLSIRACLK